ncbi:MAG: alpha/beta hydrolase [Rhodospirillaceae bacterium]|nr:alpha/beta hydrolase [Rhodospirillaceae bacterium]
MNAGPVSVRRQYIDGRFGQMHVRIAEPDTPTALPLMCFHLSPFSGQMYETWLGEIGRDRLAVAVDTPGYGYSDSPSAPPPMEEYAGAMADVADALDITDFDLMGFHTGGRIAVQLALLRPDAIKHIVLVGVGMYSREEQTKHYASMDTSEALQEDGSHLLATWQNSVRWRGPHRNNDELMKSFIDIIRNHDKNHWAYKANKEFSYVENLPQVTQPILALNPRDDLYPYTPRVAPYLNGGQLIDMPDWGLGFLDYHSQETAKMVRTFLDGEWGVPRKI